MRRGVICILIIAIALVGIACADTGVPQTAETQGFFTTTIIRNSGTSTENDALVWQEYNNGILGLDNIPPLSVNLDTIYTSSYREDTIADQGTLSYVKSTRLDTQAKPANQYNLETERIIAFEGSTSGLLTTDEDLLLDGAGTSFPTSSLRICPFAQSGISFIPPFCNVVETGSSVDITTGTLATEMAERHVMPANNEGLILTGFTNGQDGLYLSEARPAPISDAGVEVNHDFSLTGVDGEGYAEGSASAFINVHIQESRMGVILGHTDGFGYPLGGRSSDLVYTDGSAAAGRIYLFQKDMRYSSEITQPGEGVIPF